MCRLLAYKGAPIVMDKLIYEPKNSLIRQSYDAKEIEEPLNGDGFGVGWYQPTLGPEPAVFVSSLPAWSNRNLRYLAPKIESPCIFAHVRAASFGDTSDANCHPFHYKKFLMMHNGSIEGFDQIKRQLRRSLTDPVYSWVRGQTDSEHFFSLFLDRMEKFEKKGYRLSDLVEQFHEAINEVEAWKRAHKIKEGTYLNAVISDGTHLVAARFYSLTDDEPLSLYVSEGSRYVCEDGVCRMVKADPKEHSVLVVSEKLTTMRQDWKKIPPNHFVTVDGDGTVGFTAISIDKKYKIPA